ncbi:MAG: polysaccharide deacetylase family protein [Eubacterium sp.]|nr:polysaccharide deacetylase family protein [Eubacterium sp.]
MANKIRKFINKVGNNSAVVYAVVLGLVCLVGLLGIRPFMLSKTAEVAAAKKALPIYCVDRDDNKIAISFDAAWGAEDTDEILEILKANDVRATFFLCGYWVDKYPEEVKKMYEAGHDIGNHSNTHPHGSKLSLEQNKAEITGVHNKVKELLGIDMELYRPPYGEYNDTVLNAAKECGYYSIQWDVDSLDWKEQGVEAEINQVLSHKHLGSGSIILFHNDTKYTPDCLDTIIKGLKEKGYEIVPVSELILRGEYYMNHEGRQIEGSSETE